MKNMNRERRAENAGDFVPAMELPLGAEPVADFGSDRGEALAALGAQRARGREAWLVEDGQGFTLWIRSFEDWPFRKLRI